MRALAAAAAGLAGAQVDQAWGRPAVTDRAGRKTQLKNREHRGLGLKQALKHVLVCKGGVVLL